MEALVIESIGCAQLKNVPDPELGAEDVLIKVAVVGLCGSDLNTFSGLNPLVALPRIPGHEVSGTIIAKGGEVGAELAVGSQVILWPYTACGECSSCRKGRTNACRYNKTLGVQQEGALREQIVVPAHNVICNDTLSPRHQALVEPLSVGFHAAARGRVAPGDHVLVIGCGMIGLGAIMAAAAKGATVTAVDPLAAKRNIALEMGASRFTTSVADALRDEVYGETGGDGADMVIEAVGLPETFVAAVDLAAFGGRVVYVGYSKQPVSYETQVFNLKELDIMGSRNATRQDFDDVIAALEGLGDKADQLITRIFPFSQAAATLPHWVDNRADVLKLMVQL